MKKILFVFAMGLILFVGCTGTKSTSHALENESFLVFIGVPGNYHGGVEVNIDDKTKFTAEVVKDNADRPKGNVYAISTGTHIVTVTYNQVVILKKQIFISNQETKKIILP